MAKIVLTDVEIVIGGQDISNFCNSITLDYSADTPEKSGFGDDTHIMLAGGAFNWTAALQANQDYDSAAGLDQVLFPLVGTEIAFTGKPTSAAVSANNPQYSGQAILASYTPIGGNWADPAASPINLVAASKLARATS